MKNKIILLSVIIFLILILFLFIKIFFPRQIIVIPENIKFEENFTFKEKFDTIKLITELKPEYVANSNITFTKTLLKGEKNQSKIRYGLNRNKGNIFIWYNKDFKKLKNTLCHELLHNIVLTGEEYHPFVYDLAKLNVCYKNENFINNHQF